MEKLYRDSPCRDGRHFARGCEADTVVAFTMVVYEACLCSWTKNAK
jgi:hypothetical protein